MASIFLAVGHGVSTDGTWDSGCTYGADSEASLMFDIAGYAVDALRASGVTVLTDHDTGNDRNCTYTIRDANAAGVDAYMSLHCDYDQAPSGTLPIIYPGSDSGMKLANAVNTAYQGACGIGTRGILQRDDMEVANTNMPACIFETGSIKADNALLHDASRCGRAIAKGVCNYFGVTYLGGSTPATSAPATSTPEAAPAVTNKYGFTSIFNSGNYLEVGSEGENVAQLQRDLNFCGYRDQDGNRFVEDGDFGAKTKYGVECVERFHGIDDDGEYGQNADISLMTEVADIQRALVEHGYNITVDGASGQESCRALNDFQLRNGLEVDCSCGDATRAKLGI